MSQAAPAVGRIVIQPPEPCFVNEVNVALSEIAAAGLVDVVTYLQSSPDDFVITRVHANSFAVSFNESQPGGGRLGSVIGWDPDIGTPYASWPNLRLPNGGEMEAINDGGRFVEGLCIDSYAVLAHELQHAYEQAMGTIDDSEHAEDNYVLRSEVSAVRAENKYRTAHSLCARTGYAGFPIYSIPKPDRDGPCGRRGVKAAPCPERRSICMSTKCCCWVYGLLTIKTDTGHIGAIACWKRITPAQCEKEVVPNKINAACYDLSTCKNPDPSVPFC
jgi:hypothetical protein